MEINGKVFKILPQEEITFNDGTKKMKGGFVIMRDGEVPVPVAFELFGEERIALLNGLNIGMYVSVSFYVDSREGKNGKYYTTLRCLNVVPLVAGIPSAAASIMPASPMDAIPSQNQAAKESSSASALNISDDEPPF